MGKILAAALTVGVLGFGLAATDASAQMNGTTRMNGSSHGKWHQPMKVPMMKMNRHCKTMKTWHHGRPMWVKKCW